MFMIFLIIYFDEGLSNLRSSKNNNKESDDLPRIQEYSLRDW